MLRVKTDAVSVGQGDTALVAVDVFRKNGFDGPMRIEVQGLPAGFVASAATIPAGQTDGQLTITAPADAALGCTPHDSSARPRSTARRCSARASRWRRWARLSTSST